MEELYCVSIGPLSLLLGGCKRNLPFSAKLGSNDEGDDDDDGCWCLNLKAHRFDIRAAQQTSPNRFRWQEWGIRETQEKNQRWRGDGHRP